MLSCIKVLARENARVIVTDINMAACADTIKTLKQVSICFLMFLEFDDYLPFQIDILLLECYPKFACTLIK